MNRRPKTPHAELCAWANGLRPDSMPIDAAHQPADPNCVRCNGKGSCDSGGETPWGVPIDVRCDCTYQ